MPVPLTAEGLDVDALERVLAARPGRRDAVPDPHLPEPGRRVAASCGPPARRRAGREAGILIVEDDPYGLLRFEGEAAPTLHEIDGGDNVDLLLVVHEDGGARPPHRLSGAAGIAGGPLARLSENTYIGPNSFAEATLAAYCAAGRFEPNVERATAQLSSGATRWSRRFATTSPRAPGGRRPREGTSTGSICRKPSTRRVASPGDRGGVPYIKGADFCSAGRGRSSLRLAFSAVSPDQIERGHRPPRRRADARPRARRRLGLKGANRVPHPVRNRVRYPVHPAGSPLGARHPGAETAGGNWVRYRVRMR